MNKNKNLVESFGNALAGILRTCRTERNFKIHLSAAACAYLLAYLLRLPLGDYLFLTLAVFIVLIAELINTAVEAAVDLACGKTHSLLAQTAKDAAAGAVLLAAVLAVILGAIILAPPLWRLVTSL